MPQDKAKESKEEILIYLLCLEEGKQEDNMFKKSWEFNHHINYEHSLGW